MNYTPSPYPSQSPRRPVPPCPRRDLAVGALRILACVLVTTTSAQAWEIYPQEGFGATHLAVDPSGAFAYAAQESPPRLRRGDLGGTSWSELPLPAGMYRADALAAGSDGRVYATGWRYLEDGVTRAPRVWASDDVGQTWSEIGLFLQSSAYGLGVDAQGHVFLTTGRRIGTTPKYPVNALLTYKGTPDPDAPQGMAWALADNLSKAQFSHFANSLTIRPSSDPAQPAEIWVAGYAVDAKTLNTYVPVVRRSLDGGAGWADANPWPVPSGFTFGSGSWDVVAGADSSGVARVAASYGQKVGKQVQKSWLIYRSLDHGSSWEQVHTFPVGSDYGPNGIATDPAGSVFICGGGRLVASEDGGAPWNTPLPYPVASVAADRIGNVFVGGGAIYKLPAP